MPDLLRSASAWLQGVRTAAAAGPVVYRAGGASDGFTVLATVGRTLEQVNGGGPDDVQLAVQVRDYLINAADLADGLAGEPRPGHLIVEPDGTAFQVMPVPGEGAWRWSDPFRQTYRIHTKRVAARG